MGMIPASDSSLARSVDSVGWALFFIWSGASLIADIGWTWWLAGTGTIVLGIQGALLFRGGRPDFFMVAIGLVLIAGSIADRLGSDWSFVPALLIAIGLAMLADSLLGRAPRRDAGQPGR